MGRKRSTWAVAALLLLCCAALQAQPHPIHFSAHAADRAQAGAPFAVSVRASIQPGWHLYSLNEPAGGPIATQIGIGPSELVRLAGAIGSPLPETSRDPNFGLTTEFYVDSASFRIPLVVDQAARSGKRAVIVTARYQACSDRLCLRPRTDTVRVPVIVGGR